MLILCNIIVELDHFIIFNNIDKYHNLLQDEHIKHKWFKGSSCQHVVMLLVLHIIYKLKWGLNIHIFIL